MLEFLVKILFSISYFNFCNFDAPVQLRDNSNNILAAGISRATCGYIVIETWGLVCVEYSMEQWLRLVL